MSEQALQSDNSETVLKQWEAELNAVITLTGRVQKLEKGYRKKLGDALDKLYALGERLHADTILKKEFLTAHDAWDGDAESNFFIPLVRLAFPDTGKTQRSKYAKVLKFALLTKSKDQPLKEWLVYEEHTLEQRYNEAVAAEKAVAPSAGGKPSGRRGRPPNTSLVADAMKRLEGKSISQPVVLQSSIRIEGNYATVLARKTADGQIELVDFVDTKTADVDKVLKRFAKPTAALRAALEDKPLYRLFRAIELVHTLTKLPGANGSRYITLDVKSADECQIYAVSSVNNFLACSVGLRKASLPLPQGYKFILVAEGAKDDEGNEATPDHTSAISAFIESFTTQAEWTLEADEGGTFRLVSSSSSIVLKLEPLSLSGERRWRVGEFSGCEASDVTFDAYHAEGFADWLATARVALTQQNNDATEKEQFRPVVKLESGEKYVRVASLQIPNLIKNLFEIGDERVDIPGERYLSVHDVLAVEKAMTAYGLRLTGSIADRETDAAAIVLSQELEGDELKILIPVAINRTGEYAECCADYKIAAEATE